MPLSIVLTIIQNLGIWFVERRHCRTHLHVHHRGVSFLHGQHFYG